MKKWLLIALKLVITASLLSWAYSKVDQKIFDALRSAQWIWLLPGLMLGLLSQALGAARWYWFLRAAGLRPPFLEILRITFIGNFFMILSLAGLGCDVARVVLLGRSFPEQKMVIGASIIMDRLSGMVAMSVTFFACMWLGAAKAPPNAGVEYRELLRFGWFFFGGSLVFVGLCLVMALPRMYAFMKRVKGRAAALIRIPETINQSRKRWRESLLGVASAIMLALTFFASFAFAVRSLSPHQNLGAVMGAMPVIDALCSMPVSLAGIGVREKLFEIYFGSSMGLAEAVVSGTVGFCFTLVGGAIGGFLFLIDRKKAGGEMKLQCD